MKIQVKCEVWFDVDTEDLDRVKECETLKDIGDFADTSEVDPYDQEYKILQIWYKEKEEDMNGKFINLDDSAEDFFEV